VKSNITDNESGKINRTAGSRPHGVIQGYNGLAAADGKNQIIIAADANGSVAEGQFFASMLDKMAENLKAVAGKEEPLEGTTVLADTAYFSEDNLQAAKIRKVRAVIPDQQYRNRDPDLKTGERRGGKEKFDARHFKYRKQGDYYVCPNGKKLVFRGEVKLNRNEGRKYESRSKDCALCPCKEQCIKSRKKKYRTLYIPKPKYEENLSQKMRENIDKPKYKRLYSRRMQIIEPCFSGIEYCKGMDRFTLRGKKKVDIQWKLYCVVHNIGKCAAAMRKKGSKRAA
jgi:hypothetical protein